MQPLCSRHRYLYTWGGVRRGGRCSLWYLSILPWQHSLPPPPHTHIHTLQPALLYMPRVCPCPPPHICTLQGSPLPLPPA